MQVAVSSASPRRPNIAIALSKYASFWKGLWGAERYQLHNFAELPPHRSATARWRQLVPGATPESQPGQPGSIFSPNMRSRLRETAVAGRPSQKCSSRLRETRFGDNRAGKYHPRGRSEPRRWRRQISKPKPNLAHLCGEINDFSRAGLLRWADEADGPPRPSKGFPRSGLSLTRNTTFCR